MKVKIDENLYKVIDSSTGEVKYVDEAGNEVRAQVPGTSMPQSESNASTPNPGFGARFGLHSTPFRSFGIGEQALNEFIEILKEIYKAADINTVKVMPMDKDAYGLAMSLVLVVQISGEKASVFAMALEITSNSIKSVKLESVNPTNLMPYPGRRTETFTTPSDVFDKVLYDTVKEAVKSTFHISVVSIVNGVLIPEHMEFTKDKCIPISEIAYEATTIDMMSSTNNIEINIGEEIRNLKPNEQLVYRPDIGRGTLSDEVQLPKRYQFLVSLNLKSAVRNQSINIINTERTIVKTVGMVDVVPMRQQMTPMQGMIPVNVTRFRPHIILDYMHNIYTDGYLLLNIASGLVIRNNNIWMECFEDNKDDKLHDPGALNILANIENNPSGTGERIDFNAPGITSYDIRTSLQNLFMDGVYISIDVDVNSPEYWSLRKLAGSTISGEYVKSMLEHADILTDGNFSKYFNPTQNHIVSITSRIPRGYWTDANGIRRDLREIDVLAAINEFDDLGKMNEFITAYLTGVDSGPAVLPIILDGYKRIIPQGLVITGWTLRVTLTPEFTSALEAGLKDAGFGATLEGIDITRFGTSMMDVSSFYNNAAVTGQSVLVNQPTMSGFGFGSFR